jgi:hypothetical protein
VTARIAKQHSQQIRGSVEDLRLIDPPSYKPMARLTADHTIRATRLPESPEIRYPYVMLIHRLGTVVKPGSRLAAIRRKIKWLGILPKDVDRAITWARVR